MNHINQESSQSIVSTKNSIRGEKLLWSVATVNLLSLFLPAYILSSPTGSESVNWIDFLSDFSFLLYITGIILNFVAIKKIKTKPNIQKFNGIATILFLFPMMSLYEEMHQWDIYSGDRSIPEIEFGGILLIIGWFICLISAFYANNLSSSSEDYGVNLAEEYLSYLQMRREALNPDDPAYQQFMPPRNVAELIVRSEQYHEERQRQAQQSQYLTEPQPQFQPSQQPQGVIYCVRCDNPSSIEYSFCQNCGNTLSMI